MYTLSRYRTTTGRLSCNWQSSDLRRIHIQYQNYGYFVLPSCFKGLKRRRRTNRWKESEEKLWYKIFFGFGGWEGRVGENHYPRRVVVVVVPRESNNQETGMKKWAYVSVRINIKKGERNSVRDGQKKIRDSSSTTSLTSVTRGYSCYRQKKK